MINEPGGVEEGPTNLDESVAPPNVATLEPPPAPAAPGPPAKARRRRLPIIAAIAVGLLIVFGALAVVANNALSQAYSPRRAALDYFTAQQRGDVDAMWANASYSRGESSYSDYFSKAAVTAMMKLAANSDIHDVRVTSVSMVDANTATVTVSMTWHGVTRDQGFTVRKDSSRVHWLLYPSWRIEIPSSTIQLTLPNQAGQVSVDGIDSPTGASAANLGVIMGFHRASMAATNLYDSFSTDVDAVGSSSSGTLKGSISQAALAAAGATVKDTLNHCDASKYEGCFNHTYNAPNQNFIWYMPVPGYGNVNYTRYAIAMTGDPTAGMTVTVAVEPNKVTVSGSCTSTLTVDGTRHYSLRGDWSGTLTWNGGNFDSDLTWNCTKAKG